MRFDMPQVEDVEQRLFIMLEYILEILVLCISFGGKIWELSVSCIPCGGRILEGIVPCILFMGRILEIVPCRVCLGV